MHRILTFQKALVAGCAFALALGLPSAAGAQTLTVLKNLNKDSGDHPSGTLFMDAQGDLFGTASRRGLGCSRRKDPGCGVVFKIAPGNVYSVLYRFCSQTRCLDGYNPQAGVTGDSQGNLYGTTQTGGSGGSGTVFKISPNGAETLLHSFCMQSGCADGGVSHGSLMLGGDNNLYGTTQSGGSKNEGVIFRLAPDGSNYTVLYNFCSSSDGKCTDGADPQAGLIADSHGNLYGTTMFGGATESGTVYKLAPDGTETVLYSFCAQANCTDGGTPLATLVADSNGNLYGTAVGGGASNDGVVFEMAPDGSSYSVLHAFAGSDGEYPQSSLVGDAQGNLYGVTSAGGSTGRGVLYEIPSGGAETTLYTFCSKRGCSDGSYPDELGGGLIVDGSGNIYGTTWDGGLSRGGIVYKFTP
jgi:uncharacterized repeat protein (TIGR03803 family)